MAKQPLEIILIEKRSVFHALFVQDIALDGKLPQHLGGPLAELGGPYRVDPVAHGDDGVQVVVFGGVGFAVAGSYSEFLNN